MAETTMYDVKVQYLLADKASAGLGNIAKEANHASAATGALSAGLGQVAALVLGAGAIATGKHVFIDFNNEMEKLRISMGAVIQMNMGGTFEEAQKQAKGLFEDFQNFAKVTPLTTKQVAEFGNNIAAGVFAAGGSMKDFVTLTKQGALAAQVLGAQAEYAGIEMQEILAGAVSKRMRFAVQLLTPTLAKHKMTLEQFRAASAKERMSILKESLANPGLTSATKAYEHSFSGVTSTLIDNIQIALGKVGLPLFKAITREIGKWNDWMTKNEAVIAKWGDDLSGGLVAAFSMLKDFAGWLSSNADTLKLLAELVVGFKVAKFGAGLAQSTVGIISSFGVIKDAAMSLGFSLGPMGLVGVIGGFIGIMLAYQARVEMEDRKKKMEFAKITEAGTTFAASHKTTADRGQLVESVLGDLAGRFEKKGYEMSDKGLEDVYRQPQLMADHIASQMGYTGKELADASNAIIETVRSFDSMDNFKEAYRRTLEGVREGLQAPEIDDLKRGGMAGKANVNVTVQKIEVASDDPDRFVFGMVRAFEAVTKNPTGAFDGLRGGL